MLANDSNFIELISAANEANERERTMRPLEAVKVYYMAIAWSVLASLGIFGSETSEGFRDISQMWQKGINAAASVGAIIGFQIASPISDRFGHRWTIISVALASMVFSLIPIFAESLPVFLVGYFLQQTALAIHPAAIAYISEICPTSLRHVLIACSFLFSVIGSLVATGVATPLLGRQDEWGYRNILMTQWVWPLPIAVGMYYAPESPWWCVKKGRLDSASGSLKRLARKSSQQHITANLALMLYVDSTEREASKDSTYRDCFRGTNGRRTELACVAWVADAICSVTLGGLTSSLYSKAAIPFNTQFSVSIGVSVFALASTFTTWVILDKIGRKSLFLGCLCAAMAILLTAGLLGVSRNLSNSGAIVAGSLLMVLLVVANIVSPVAYTIVAEIPSTRLRVKSIALARGAYHIVDVGFVATISENQLDPRGWNWGLKSCLFWAGINLIFATYIYFRLPETKGRTYAELSILFNNKVPARKFKSSTLGPLKISSGNAREDLAIRIANHQAYHREPAQQNYLITKLQGKFWPKF
ncbi:hypothetical protein F4808DRAFT_468253 [Astrocystis sublimbata]|nr:hypothetical protein F4808DRAFT_468253 [Astrocystis sublimbata]